MTIVGFPSFSVGAVLGSFASSSFNSFRERIYVLSNLYKRVVSAITL